MAKITDVSEKWYFDDPKHPHKVWVVTYETDQRTTGSVEVQDADAKPDKILAAVAAEIKRVHSVVGTIVE
jgi:hypothetical protein